MPADFGIAVIDFQFRNRQSVKWNGNFMRGFIRVYKADWYHYSRTERKDNGCGIKVMNRADDRKQVVIYDQKNAKSASCQERDKRALGRRFFPKKSEKIAGYNRGAQVWKNCLKIFPQGWELINIWWWKSLGAYSKLLGRRLCCSPAVQHRSRCDNPDCGTVFISLYSRRIDESNGKLLL